MKEPPSKVFATRPTMRAPQGKLSPWLESARKVTGLDPRNQNNSLTVLLLDCSSSMSDSIAEALAGARAFNNDALLGGHSVGLVIFSTEASLVTEPNRAGIVADLEKVTCSGTTNMAAAIAIATSCLERRSSARTIVLATDGQPDDRDAALVAATRAKSMGIRIVTIGITGADTDFLKQLASSHSMTMSARSGEIGKTIAIASRLLLK